MAGERVTLDTFIRAETDTYFQKKIDGAGGIGILKHDRAPTPIDNQPIIRMNRDTLYSTAVFDLTDPVTITTPETGDRFVSMVVTNEDHYIKLVAYEAGDYTLTEEKLGTRYAQVVFRTFVNPNVPEDVRAANDFQNRIAVTQNSPGTFSIPDWDQDSLSKVREAILALGPYVGDSSRMFGDVSETEPVRHMIGTAGGFGGNRTQDAIYLNITPEKADGQTPYVLTVKDVPVDGFWSISLYNAEGVFEKNEYAANSVNNLTAIKNDDGSVTVHFGGDPNMVNFLYIMKGWNYVVRLYRPRREIQNGSWKFPDAVVVN
ncbi:hypothetical protein CO654_02210 [Rhizobium sp. L18]|nr:hypothetical protein CO654_02210 [Rhizobium sp. L18]